MYGLHKLIKTSFMQQQSKIFPDGKKVHLILCDFYLIGRESNLILTMQLQSFTFFLWYRLCPFPHQFVYGMKRQTQFKSESCIIGSFIIRLFIVEQDNLNGGRSFFFGACVYYFYLFHQKIQIMKDALYLTKKFLLILKIFKLYACFFPLFSPFGHC